MISAGEVSSNYSFGALVAMSAELLLRLWEISVMKE